MHCSIIPSQYIQICIETMDEINYFTCTLGHAAVLNKQSPHKYSTVNEFLDFQAQKCPSTPAVGLPYPSHAEGGKWDARVLSNLKTSRISDLP